MALLISFLIIVLILIISALPLHLAVTFFGGRSSILKVLFVNLLVAVVAWFIEVNVGMLAGALSFIALLFIYKYMFNLGLLRSFLVWLVQFVIAALLFFLASLFGLAAYFI